MKKRSIFTALVVLAFLSASLTSCLGNDDDVIYTDDAAITAFSLGTVYQYSHVTSSQGTDSIVKTSVTSAAYRFYIDQLNREIYNPDSLPYGTDAEHILCTIVSRNSGTVTFKDLEDEDKQTYYNSSDSIDFRQPRTVYVYSISGKGRNTYTIRVNVHQQEPDEFNWTLVADGGMPFGTDHYKQVLSDPEAMRHVADGVLYEASPWSAEPQWSKAFDIPGVSQMLHYGQHRLYAIDATGRLVASSNAPTDWANGVVWEPESIEEDNADQMPDEDLRLVRLPSLMNVGANYLVLVGRNTRMAEGSNAVVWGKVEETDQYAEHQPWYYYTPAAMNKYPLPALRNLQAVPYDGGILAFGTQDDGQLSPIYLSRDKGLTWPETSLVALPEDFRPTTTDYALVAGSDGYLWLADGAGKRLWRGRLNRLGWKEIDRSITE